MKFLIITKEIKELAKLQGIDLQINQKIMVVDENKRQQQKLIFDYFLTSLHPTYMRVCNKKNVPAMQYFSYLMIKNNFSKNDMVYIPGLKKCFLGEVRKSLALESNSKKSYLSILEMLKEEHLALDPDSYFEYFKEQDNKYF